MLTHKINIFVWEKTSSWTFKIFLNGLVDSVGQDQLRYIIPIVSSDIET